MKLISILLVWTIMASNPISNEVRVSFYEASVDLDKREAFYSLAMSKKDESAVAQCYFGAAQTLMAELSYNPYTKLSYFNDGKTAIEDAIRQNEDNPELRYVRFMIQSNAPDFLGYNDNISQDLSLVEKAIQSATVKETWMLHFETYQQAKKEYP